MRLLWCLALTAGLLLAEASQRQSNSDLKKRLLAIIYTEFFEESISDDNDSDDPMFNEAVAFLRSYDKKNIEINHRQALADFNYKVNITDENSKELEDANVLASTFASKRKLMAAKYIRHSDNWPASIKRQLKKIASPVVSSDPFLTREMAQLSNNLSQIHATAKVCEKTGSTCHSLQPDLTDIMATSRDYDELLWTWKGWLDATGPKMKASYTRMVELMNTVATENGFEDTAAAWMEDNDETNPSGFEKLCDQLLAEVMPLYRELHAYVRGRLAEQYGRDKVDPNKPIPVHLLGNMWAQDWSNLNAIVNPYPNKLFQEAEASMKADPNVDFLTIVKAAEEFYTSIGLSRMTKAFWKYSMLTRPTDGREAECHGAAIDLWTGDDYRVMMCGEVKMEDLYVIHHEMGHIEYFMAYANQPSVFRDGAHAAFHEAVGDTIGLSVVTPKHLSTIGLVSAEADTDENSISFLLNLALQKVAFLPFGYLVDKWRWAVFRGEIEPDEYTTSWWRLYQQHMGLAPAVPRDDPRLFDPGSKFHIPIGVPYIRYFLSFILQFHFHEALCNASGHVGPCHKCDIYDSKAAGKKLLNMLQLGSSKPWPDALEQLTGARMFDTGPLRRYFEPLRLWLEKQNQKNNYTVGWSVPGKDISTKGSSKKKNSAISMNASFGIIIAAFLGAVLLHI